MFGYWFAALEGMDTLKEHLRRIGRNGGASKSQRKRLSSLANLEKANAKRIAQARAKQLAKVKESA